MLHAGIATAFRDRLVKQIVRRRSAKFRDIACTKPADRLSDELKLRNRNEVETTQLLLAALCLRIERADRFQRVTEKIEPYRHIHARWKQVEDSATYSVLTRLAYRRRTNEAIELKPVDDPLHAYDVARRDRKSVRGDEIARRHPLQGRIHRRKQHGRTVAALYAHQLRQCRHTLRDDGGIGRNPVVGQTVPGRVLYRFDIRTEKCQRARQCRHTLAVPTDDGK